MPLRPLIVVTGSIHVEGGDTHSVRQKREPKHMNGTATHALVHRRTVTDDRRAANVISTEAMRQLRKLRVLKTPFGALVLPEQLDTVKELIADATKRAAEFNVRMGPDATARLTNCLLWEHLRGGRLASVEGWIARGVHEKRPEVVAAVPVLTAPC